MLAFEVVELVDLGLPLCSFLRQHINLLIRFDKRNGRRQAGRWWHRYTIDRCGLCATDGAGGVAGVEPSANAILIKGGVAAWRQYSKMIGVEFASANGAGCRRCVGANWCDDRCRAGVGWRKERDRCE